MNFSIQPSAFTQKLTTNEKIVITLSMLVTIVSTTLSIFSFRTIISQDHALAASTQSADAPTPLVDPASEEVRNIINDTHTHVDTHVMIPPTPSTTRITGGMPIKIKNDTDGENTYANCSLGPVIDHQRALTAAHCAKNTPATVFDNENNFIGVIQHADTNVIDAAVIHLNPSIRNNNITVNHIRTTKLNSGETLIKSGRATGTIAGTLQSIEGHTAHFNDISTVSLIANGCIRAGDSGGLITDAQGRAVGIASYTSDVADDDNAPPGICTSPHPAYGFVPLADALIATDGE